MTAEKIAGELSKIQGNQIARELIAEARANPGEWKRAWTPSGAVFFRSTGGGLNDGEWFGWYPHILPFLSTCAWSNDGYYGDKWSARPTLPIYWSVRKAVRAILENDNAK